MPSTFQSTVFVSGKNGKMCVLDSSHVASLLIYFYKKKDDLGLREIGGGGAGVGDRGELMSAWIPGSKKMELYSTSLSLTLTSWLAKRSWERSNHRGVRRERNVPWDTLSSPSVPTPQHLHSFPERWKPKKTKNPPKTPQKDFSFKRCHLRIKPRGHWILAWQENVQFAFIKMQEAVGRERKGQRDCQ